VGIFVSSSQPVEEVSKKKSIPDAFTALQRTIVERKPELSQALVFVLSF